MSGAGAWTVLVTVTLRLLLPAIAAAAVLVFVLTLGTFAIPQVLGAPAGFSTVTTRIYADLSIRRPVVLPGSGHPGLAAGARHRRLRRARRALLGPRLRERAPGRSPGRSGGAGTAGAGRAQAAALGGYLVLTTALPLMALLLSSVTRALGVPPTPANWGLDHFREVLTPRTFEALGRSVGLAVAAASLLVLLGGLVAVRERRRSGRATASLIT